MLVLQMSLVFADDEKQDCATVPEAAKAWSWSNKQDSLDACAKKFLAEFDVALIKTETCPQDGPTLPKRGEFAVEIGPWPHGTIPSGDTQNRPLRDT
jgi:hypothetical protein